jgi:pilus assembly protein CpaB
MGANFFVLVIAIALGGIAAFLSREWLVSHSANVAEVEQAGTIVVANATIAFGAAVTADNAIEIPWPSKQLPDGAFASVQDLVKDGRRVALSPFVRNEPIVASKVTAPNQRASLSTVIEEGKRAVTVAVDDVRGVAGFISPGDFVDIVLTRTGSNEGPQNFSEVILQHIKVLAIDQLAGDRQERAVVAKAVTVEVTPEQSLKILLATNIGRLSLILRQSAETSMAPEQRVTDKDLYANEAVPPPAAPAASSGPVSIATPEPKPTPTTRRVTIVRGLKGEDYDVPKDARAIKSALDD